MWSGFSFNISKCSQDTLAPKMLIPGSEWCILEQNNCTFALFMCLVFGMLIVNIILFLQWHTAALILVVHSPSWPRPSVTLSTEEGQLLSCAASETFGCNLSKTPEVTLERQFYSFKSLCWDYSLIHSDSLKYFYAMLFLCFINLLSEQLNWVTLLSYQPPKIPCFIISCISLCIQQICSSAETTAEYTWILNFPQTQAWIMTILQTNCLTSWLTAGFLMITR